MSRPIVIVGAGSLGQTFAAALAQNGHQVTLLATPGSTERLLAAGKIRLIGAMELDVPTGPAGSTAGTVSVTDDSSSLPAGAGMIFTTKSHQIAEAARAIRSVWPRPDDKDAWVAGVQNGIMKDDILADVFGAERVIGAVTITGAARQASGAVAVASRGATYFGEFDGKPSARAAEIAAAFTVAGLPAEQPVDIKSVLWSKMCNATGFFAVSTLSRVSSSHFGHYPELIRVYLDLVRETAAIANALGVEIGSYAGFPIKKYLDQTDEETLAFFAANAVPFDKTQDGPPSRTSMLQDLVAERPLEVDEIFADAVARAERLGVPAVRLTVVRDLIRAIDPGRTARLAH